MWNLLRDTRIRRVWLGEVCNSLGSALGFWALAWLLYRTFPAQSLLVGALLGTQTLFLLLGTLTFGPFLDHWNRRRTLVFSNTLLGLLTLLLPLLVKTDARGPLFWVMVTLGVASSLPRPARSAALPSFAPMARSQALQTLFGLTDMTANLLAPVLAGVLISALGAANVLYLDALSFLVGAGVYLSVRFPTQMVLERARNIVQVWLENLTVGLHFVCRRPALWGTLLSFGCVNALMEVYGALLLPRVSEKLMQGVPLARDWGQDRAALGLGLLDFATVLVELLFSLWLGARAFTTAQSLRWLTLGCLIPPLGVLGVLLSPTLALGLLFSAWQGLGFAVMSSLLGVFVARVTPEHLRGRVSSVRVFLASAPRPLATFVGGALLGPLGVVGLGGVLVGSATALITYGMGRARSDKDCKLEGDRTT